MLKTSYKKNTLKKPEEKDTLYIMWNKWKTNKFKFNHINVSGLNTLIKRQRISA